MATFCTHVAVSHEKLKDATDAYDNLARIIGVVEGLFWVIHATLSGNENEVAEVAGLGGDLCEELSRRAELLYDFKRADEAAAAKHAKEG
jgi:hypothetical protein